MPSKNDPLLQLKELEAQNLKLEFEVSRLQRENNRLYGELQALRERGVKALTEEIVGRVDSKVTKNLKKLNRPKATAITREELEQDFSKVNNRKALLRSAQRSDLKSFYAIPKARVGYVVAMGAYKTGFGAMKLAGRGSWRLWLVAKKALKKAR